MLRLDGRSRSHCPAGLALALAALAASVASSATILELDKWMQQIDRRSQAVQRSLARRDAEAATADARELARLYQDVEEFFARRTDASDAVQASKDGGALATTIVRSLEVKDYDAASTAALRLAQSCRECHDVYKPLK